MPTVLDVYAHTSKESPSQPPQIVPNYPVQMFILREGETAPALFRSQLTSPEGHIRFKVGHGHYLLCAGKQSEARIALNLPFTENDQNVTIVITVDPNTSQAIDIEKRVGIANGSITID